MFTQSQVMYSLSRKQANECSIRSTDTNENNRIDTKHQSFLLFVIINNVDWLMQ